MGSELVLAARGSEGSRVRVEIMDVNQIQTDFILNLRPVFQNFTLDMTGFQVPPGFNPNQIAQIVFVNDQSNAPANDMDLVKIKVKGLDFTLPPPLSVELQAFRDDLVQKGVEYFKIGGLLDPATHFPYDGVNTDGTLESNSKFTQPTLIGFYLQMLGDAVAGELSMGMTTAALLTEIEFVMDRLAETQASIGWNGLLPFMHLDQGGPDPVVVINPEYGFGDNTNLAQSLAVMMGALEGEGLTGALGNQVNDIVIKAEQYLDNMEPGFVAGIELGNGDGSPAGDGEGFFRNSVIPVVDPVRCPDNPAAGTPPCFFSFMDRTMTEFRGGIAFVATRYDSIPDSVWDLLVTPITDYTDQNGNVIPNPSVFDGSAFQTFWPLLRNNEQDFIGFRNSLYNQYVTHADFSNLYHIPGFLSASEIPENNGEYVGELGIRELQEGMFGELTMDVGSTYALASAYLVDPVTTLTWLKAISDQLPAINGTYGFADGARSNTEMAPRFLGIDIGSTVLGLVANGPEAFETYLRNRGLELEFNLLYDSKDDELALIKTNVTPELPPEFPDRSLSVFRNTDSIFGISDLPIDTSFATGIHLQYGTLSGGFGAQGFNLNQNYDAAANKLVLQYSAVDPPQFIKIDLKDAADQLLFSTIQPLPNVTPGLSVAKLEIDLPDIAALSAVQKVILVIDQNDPTQPADGSGDFFIHSMNFLHLPSSD